MTSTTLNELVVEFAWRVHPARDRRRHALRCSLFIVVFATLLGVAFSSVAVGVVSVLVLVIALNRFYLPSRFEIDAEGLTARYPLRTQRLAWADVRRFVVDAYGGYLSTRAVRSRLDAFSGMHLLFNADRDDAVTQIRKRLAQRAAS